MSLVRAPSWEYERHWESRLHDTMRSANRAVTSRPLEAHAEVYLETQEQQEKVKKMRYWTSAAATALPAKADGNPEK